MLRAYILAACLFLFCGSQLSASEPNADESSKKSAWISRATWAIQEAVQSEAYISSRLNSNDVSEALVSARNTHKLLLEECGKSNSMTIMFGRIVVDIQRASLLNTEQQTAFCKLHRERCEIDKQISGDFDVTSTTRLLESHLNTLKDGIGTDSLSYIMTLMSLIAIEGKHAEYGRMKKHSSEALSLIEEVLGKDVPIYANALEGLGVAQLKLGELSEASKALQDYLEIRKQNGETRSLAYAAGLVNLSRVRLLQKRIREAELLALEATQLSSSFGQGHELLSGLCDRLLGEIYLAEKRYAESNNCFERAITNFEAFPSFRDALAEVYELKAEVLRHLERPEESALYRKKAQVLNRPPTIKR